MTADFTYSVPKGIPFMIAGATKAKLATNADPDIADFGNNADNHIVEKFIAYMQDKKLDGTRSDDMLWTIHLNDFLADYFARLPPIMKMMISMNFPGDVLSKSLKAIVYKSS